MGRKGMEDGLKDGYKTVGGWTEDDLIEDGCLEDELTGDGWVRDERMED